LRPSQRIVLNAISTYGRTLVGVGFALFSSRWILGALGHDDFGLFGVVGALIVFIALANSTLSDSAARHYAFSLGQGNIENVNKWFNSSLSLHVVLSALLVIVGWPVGEYMISNVLVIPADRVSACLTVFRVSLVSTYTGMALVPFFAMFTAKQRIYETASWGMLQSFLVFILSWLLLSAPGDRLVYYAFGMALILVSIQVAQVVRALRIFRECRIDFDHWFDRGRLKELFSFGAWNVFGNSGYAFRNYGSAILLNLFFGPGVNAAYGVARQLSMKANQLSNSLVRAFVPEITASEGQGNRGRVIDYSIRASKLGTLLTMLFAFPLMVEMEYFLELWLKDPPPYSADLCRSILSIFLIGRSTTGCQFAINAHGKIARYQATIGVFPFLSLPFSWAFFRIGMPPTALGTAFIITAVIVSAGQVYWANRLVDLKVGQWLKKVALPCGITAVSGFSMATLPLFFLAPSLLRLALVTASGSFAILSASWFLALDLKEKDFIRANVRKVLAMGPGVSNANSGDDRE